MRFKLWTEYGALNSAPVFEAFSSGLQKFGHTIVTKDQDVNVIWSILWKGRMLHNKQIFYDNKPVIVLEVGSIKRNSTWKVLLYNNQKMIDYTANSNDTTRPNLLNIKLMPWRTKGDKILICCQNPNSQQWYGLPQMSKWVLDTIQTIRQHTNKPIYVRQHPRSRFNFNENKSLLIYNEIPKKIKNTYDEYDLSFENCHAVINYNSNPGVQAILQGYPVFCDRSSIIAPVGNLDINNINKPICPDRSEWLVKFSHTEYTITELEKGMPLTLLTLPLESCKI